MSRRLLVLILFSVLLLSICPIINLSTPSQENILDNVNESNDDLSPSQITAIDTFKTEIYATGRSNNQTNASWVFDSAVSAGGSSPDEVFAIALDSSGNAYLTGYFRYSAHFGTYNQLTSTGTDDIFVAKLSSTGNWLWAYSLLNETGGGAGRDIVVDSLGYIYVTGQFTGEVNGCSASFSSGITPDAFVAKLDSNGTCLWATNANSVTATMDSNSIDVDSSGNAMITGFHNDATFGSYSLLGDSKLYVAKISSSGSWLWAKEPGEDFSWGHGIAIDSNDNGIVTGVFQSSLSLGGASLSGAGVFVTKIDSAGNWQWAVKGGSDGLDVGYGVAISQNNDIYLIGDFDNSETFGSFTINAVTGRGVWIAKMNQNGTWLWANWAGHPNGNNHGTNIALDSNGLIMISGQYAGSSSYSSTFGQFTLPTDSCGNVFIAGLSESGNWLWAKHIGITGNTVNPGGLALSSNGEAVVAGLFHGNDITIGTSTVYHIGSSDIFVASMSTDYDGDGIGNRLDSDDDGDLIPDVQDNCPDSEIGFMSVAINDHDSDGCRDSDNDNDDDNDGVEDAIDSCPKGIVGWIPSNSTDLDSDGCSDALEDTDDDNDGVEDYLDLCPREEGNSTFEFEEGCPDSDGDGRPDIRDPFANDSAEWSDLDGDGTGDNADEFDADATQQTDSDGDGYGDNQYGNGGDGCPNIWGDSLIGLLGCVDSDGDGWSDIGDAFPQESSQWSDRDGDGYGDNNDNNSTMIDEFPSDGTQWNDTDGDNHGDNPYGTGGDWFPNDPTRWADTDRDGVADEDDDLVNDASQWNDSDGDGYGDNQLGNRPDVFPDDSYEWADSDGDGVGNNGDKFPFDPTQYRDSDGDGYGDSPTGSLPDIFPNNPTQWEDNDGDGLGDNQSGTEADPYLLDFDNDGYNDSVDILPKLASPGDLDNDGCLDEVDLFPTDYRECLDNDGDGEGDNADTDDDNDGWTDTDEDRQNTDSLDPSDYPVEGFEIVIPFPGGAIGLGAWDLIGISGGVPLFAWILFGFVTRNARCRKFEEMLGKARTKDELEQIALKSEYALMIRLLGPHQGIRLERLRAELDDALEGEGMVFDEDHTEVVEDEMIEQEISQEDTEATFSDVPDAPNTPPAAIVAEGMADGTPSESAAPPDLRAVGIVGQDGYEWLQQGGATWYRPANSGLDWSQWMD